MLKAHLAVFEYLIQFCNFKFASSHFILFLVKLLNMIWLNIGLF